MTKCVCGWNFGCELRPLKLLMLSEVNLTSPATCCFIPQSVFWLFPLLSAVYQHWQQKNNLSSTYFFTDIASPTQSLHPISRYYMMVTGSSALQYECHIYNSERRQGPLAVGCCSMGCCNMWALDSRTFWHTHMICTPKSGKLSDPACEVGGSWGYCRSPTSLYNTETQLHSSLLHFSAQRNNGQATAKEPWANVRRGQR